MNLRRRHPSDPEPAAQPEPRRKASPEAQATINDEVDGPPPGPTDSQATFPDVDTFAQPPTSADGRPVVMFGRTDIWERVADDLVRHIAEGRYPVGARLPSVRQVMAEYRCSDKPAQRALQALVSAGIARAADRSGYYVTLIPAHPHAQPGRFAGYPAPGQALMPAPGYAQPPTVQPAPMLTRPLNQVPIEGSTQPALGTVVSLSVSAEQAPPDIARLLHLPDPQAPVILRRRLLADARQVPTELRTSYLPPEVAEATPLISPMPITQPWDQALREHARRTPDNVSVTAYGRRPTDAEAAALGLAVSAIVLVRDTVTHDANGQPIDTTRSVWPAESTTVNHRYPLTH